MEKLWSICIPTYNRASNLRVNLEYIFRQVNDDNKDLLEIIVSNNASTDDTDLVVNEYLAKGLNISYYANKENLGPDGNFLQCVAKAKGKYVLLLGDDDYLLLGAIDRIMNYLSGDEYGAVYIARNMLAPSEKFLSVQAAKAVNQGIISYDDGNEFLRHVSYFITFMSGTIFNKELLREIDSYREYNHTNLLQVSFYLTASLKSSKCAIADDSLLTTASNDNGGYALTQVFCKNFNELLNLFKPYGLKQETIDNINKDLLKEFFPFWLGRIRFKRTRFKQEDAKAILLSQYADDWRYWAFVNPIISWPKPFAWVWFTGMRVLRKLKILG